MSAPANAPHPGLRIKAEVIPLKMSVTKAARLVGVGRPALSNLLNGKAALSTDMAARLEKAFKFPRKDLMEMQAQYELAQAKKKDAPSNTKAYVPPFLSIKAKDVEQWASHDISARSRLAVFLRTLVNSTGSGLTKLEFPGNDDSESPGWDGFVEANEGTPWIPAGLSGWEFGTNEDPRKKVESDFEKRVKALDKKQRAETTFLFVTPRRWPAKASWATSKKAQGLWKDVRAYDASDIEQWLEQSLSGQAWFANETLLPTDGVRSLDKCWRDWADVSEPPLTGALFSSAIEVAKRTILSRLSKPPEKPILIAADSTEEALAFLAQLLGERGGEDLASYRDRVLVFDKPGVFPRLAAGAQTFIPVAFRREVEREFASISASMHSIVIYPRNAATIDPDIVLEPVNYETFTKALEEMGKNRDETSRLATASGRSLTVLRRQLSKIPAVRTPEWAAVCQTAAKLVPFLFVGAWDSRNETDKLGLSRISGDRSYEELEKECQSLAQLNDAPVWSVGTFRGVISKIDLLYAIAGVVTPEDLNRYFSIARMVLGEDNPALDLPVDQRWAASIYGKAREFSSAFREGISETLVLLAVHGGHLFQRRLGFNCEIEAVRVIRDLLPTPLTTRVLEANDRDLPTYAEAAPEEFLSILERDLKTDDPAVLGLLCPVDAGIFGGWPSRTGLLWALEGLSWNPETLPRAATILARLAQVEIKDNWANKPSKSLKAIFRAWMPQTAANHQSRVDLIKKLAEKFTLISWKLCVAQFDTFGQIGDYSHKPRWRPDGNGFGEPFPTYGPVIDFRREMIEMALTWKVQSLVTLSDLVERLQCLTDADQTRVWALIEAWASTSASDADKAALREKIRIWTLSQRAASHAKRNARAFLTNDAKAAYAALEPSDLLNKHAWLFREQWVEESADEVEDIMEIDFKKRDERIQDLRTQALREIREQRGHTGLLELSTRGKTSWIIGWLAASSILSEPELQDILRLAFAQIVAGREEVHSQKNLVAGALHAIVDDEKRGAVLEGLAASLSEEYTARLLVLSPYRKSTWKLVDALSESNQAKYWSEVTPDWIRDSDAESSESVERLLKAGRPRAAFYCVRLELEKLDAKTLFRLLSEVAQGGSEQPGHYQLEPYSVEKAFRHLNNSSDLTLEQKAGLEFAYIEILANQWGGHYIPNLERYIETHPQFFVQAVVWAYERNDGASDPVEFQVPPDRVEICANNGRKLLEAIRCLPGHNDLGELEALRLTRWIATVRELCAELSRTDSADRCIGKLLSGAPIGKDGVWPCEPVRDAMEEIQSERMMRGADIGAYNARGAPWRGEGGDQQRELANKYREWGLALQVSHPFVASKLLMSLAKTYEHEASREDTEAGIRRRLR